MFKVCELDVEERRAPLVVHVAGRGIRRVHDMLSVEREQLGGGFVGLLTSCWESDLHLQTQ